MSAFVDTNVLIRHLTGDPPRQAARATRFLAEADELLLADLIVAETVYVLESFYEVGRARVAELVRAIIAFEAVRVVDEELLLRASRYTRSTVSISRRPTWSPAQNDQETTPSPPSTGPSTASRRSDGSSQANSGRASNRAASVADGR